MHCAEASMQDSILLTIIMQTQRLNPPNCNFLTGLEVHIAYPILNSMGKCLAITHKPVIFFARTHKP